MAAMSSASLRKLIIPAIIIGVLLIVVAVVYFAEPAKSLPSFFPGHVAKSNYVHSKRGIAALVVALVLFAFAAAAQLRAKGRRAEGSY
jgi:hypothetical protein